MGLSQNLVRKKSWHKSVKNNSYVNQEYKFKYKFDVKKNVLPINEFNLVIKVEISEIKLMQKRGMLPVDWMDGGLTKLSSTAEDGCTLQGFNKPTVKSRSTAIELCEPFYSVLDILTFLTTTFQKNKFHHKNCLFTHQFNSHKFNINLKIPTYFGNENLKKKKVSVFPLLGDGRTHFMQ